EAATEGFDDADHGRDAEAVRAAARYLTTVVAIWYGSAKMVRKARCVSVFVASGRPKFPVAVTNETKGDSTCPDPAVIVEYTCRGYPGPYAVTVGATKVYHLLLLSASPSMDYQKLEALQIELDYVRGSGDAQIVVGKPGEISNTPTNSGKDISESSATWWQGVLNAVEQTYKKWLAASPIEKLAIAHRCCWEQCQVIYVQTWFPDGAPRFFDDFNLRLIRLGQRPWPSLDQVVGYHKHLQAELEPEMLAVAGKGRHRNYVDISQRPTGSETALLVARQQREALVQAAQQMVQTQGGESPGGDGSPEKTRPTMKVLQLRDIRVCTMEATTSALLDSGATHSLRSATSEKEWDEAEPVGVQLAGNHQLVMRITKSGTLLMPWRSSLTGKHNHPHAQTIVPMGQLIKTSGYTMVWTPHECYLCNDTGERIPLQLSGGCPQMKELEALALIARLEDRKLDLLNNEVMATEEKVSMAAMAMEKHWTHYLYDYVTTGSFESGLRAVRDAPFFEDIPGECLSNLIPSAGLWSGWDILKQIGWLTRPQRRKVLTSKRWVVHLFAGKEGHWEFMKLDQGDTTVLELDLARSYGQDVMRNEVWRMLLWGAKEGKVDVVFGGPPGRSQQNLKGGLRDTKSLTLVARMMWLYVVAQVGREVNGGVVNKNRDVGFIMEYPEGLTPEEKIDRELRVLRAEDQSRVSAGRGGVASWDHTRQFWENVQRPTWEEWVGVCTVDASRSFWDTRMWKMFSREADLHEVSFDQGAMGRYQILKRCRSDVKEIMFGRLDLSMLWW
ncbi:unnamed protein product, partial [Symbiodinium sp. KB8]